MKAKPKTGIQRGAAMEQGWGGEFRVIVTCEHGGNHVPARWQAVFHGREEVLQTHRGYDIGILPLAQQFSWELPAPLFFGTVTRLLVDLNRSLHSCTLFSEFTRGLAPAVRELLLREYYLPYRREVTATVAGAIAVGGRVLHLSLHSFTPELNGRSRRADLGLLYDPARRPEQAFCRLWQQALRELAPTLLVRCNYPYRGVSDSLVSSLARRYPAERYLGIELEVNQKHAGGEAATWRQLQEVLIRSLRLTLAAAVEKTPGSARLGPVLSERNPGVNSSQPRGGGRRR